MGLFDQINFAAASSADSSYDLRLLDTPCDHNLRDEFVNNNFVNLSSVSGNPTLTTTPYSGSSTIYGTAIYGGAINPTGSLIFTTQYPYVGDGSLSILQGVNSTVANPITETITIQSPVGNGFNLMYPPRTNTVIAKQKIILSNNEIKYIPFTRYNLLQLFGKIQFTNPADVGAIVVFKYLADKKKILQKNFDGTINYQFEGINKNNQGIFSLYGRALLSTAPLIYIRYKTQQPYCPKCNGSGMLNDLNLDANGRLQLVYDFSKLIQDYFKRLYTQKGSNSFDLSDGTELPNLIGLAKNDGSTTSAIIQAEIINLLFQIRNKQAIQKSIQTVGLGEQVAQINKIDVRALNATDFSVTIDVTSKSGLTQQIGSTISLINGVQ